MRFTDLWAAMVTRNPRLANPEATVTITAANFKRALEQAYDQGAKAMREAKDQEFASIREVTQTGDDGLGWFNKKIFG